MELNISFCLSAARDKDDDAKMEEWKRQDRGTEFLALAEALPKRECGVHLP